MKLYILHYFIGVIPLQFFAIPLRLYILKYTKNKNDLFDVFRCILAIKHWLNPLNANIALIWKPVTGTYWVNVLPKFSYDLKTQIRLISV